MASGAKVRRLAALVALSPTLAPGIASADDASRFRPERWSEDWRGSNAPLKDIALSSSVSLTLGADARVKTQMLDAPHLGIDGELSDNWILLRALIHADLHVGRRARAFVQVGAHDAIDHNDRNPTDDDKLDVNQAFVDLNGAWGDTHATLRLGRQELDLGSPRYVTLRDNTNLRQRHDLARLIVTGGPWRVDLFSGRPTDDRPGPFDDRADPEQEFFGARLQRRFGDVAANLEYYDLSREDFTMAGVTANDRRHSTGVRLAGTVAAYDFDAEFLAQTGEFGLQEVHAVGGAIDIGRRFSETPLSPRLGARFTYGSGDSDPLDDRQETFAPPFPRNGWFGQTGLSSFSNSIEAAATLDLEPHEDTSIDLKVGGLWREDTHDLVYAGTSRAIAGTRGGDAFSTVTASALATWRADENVTMSAYASVVFPGDHLRSVGGDVVNYVQTSFTYRF